MKNSFINRSHLSEKKFCSILKCFVDDLTSLECAKRTKVNRNTTSRLYSLMRQRICEMQLHSLKIPEEIDPTEVDFAIKGILTHSCFNDTGEVFHVAILNDEGTLRAQIVSDDRLMQIASMVSWKLNETRNMCKSNGEAVQILRDMAQDFNFHVCQGEKRSVEISNDENRMDEIDNFLAFSKARLKKFYGIKSDDFKYHLAECCFRWNCRNDDMFVILKSAFLKEPL